MSIFVSYSRLDEVVVKALAAGLEAARREVWFDHDLGGGEVWWVRILQNIRQADVVIFALSDNALQSKPCRAELDYAVALERNVLPIQVGPVANFRANPLSALQTIEFRADDAFSAFAIIAAIDEAAKRRRPLPEVLPPEPQIPFAYLSSLNKQIDSGELTPRAQLDAVDELRKAYREETDRSVHADILAILRSLKAKPWATVQTAGEVDAVLAWAASRLPTTAAETTPGSMAGPSTAGAARSTGSVEEAERRHRREFERTMTETVLRQNQERERDPAPRARRPEPPGGPPPPSSTPAPQPSGGPSTTPPPLSRPRRRWRWIVASLSVVLAIVVLATLVRAVSSAGTDPPPGGGSSSVSRTPSSSPSLSADERRLLEHLPPAIAASCTSYQPPPNALAAVTCRANPAITVRYYQYAEGDDMDVAFGKRYQLNESRPCAKGEDSGIHAHPEGQYNCFLSKESGSRVLNWTHDPTRIMGVGLSDTATFAELLEWWPGAGPT